MRNIKFIHEVCALCDSNAQLSVAVKDWEARDLCVCCFLFDVGTPFDSDWKKEKDISRILSLTDEWDFLLKG